MVASSSLPLSTAYFLLSLIVFLPGSDAQTYSSTQNYWSTPYYTTTQPTISYVCGRSTFNDPIGNITSPNYPNQYNNRQVCEFFIVAPSLSTINFKIFVAYLEPNANCVYDWVEFTCQSNSISRTVRYCGVDSRSELSYKPCSRVIVRFVSDGSVVGAGFFVSYDIKPISCQGNCTPVAIGAGYNCTCDANQTDPFVAPPYDRCPTGCHMSDTPTFSSTFCACNYSSTASTTTPYRPTPSVPSCPSSCYSYYDGFGYPVCYCNVSSTTQPPTVPSCPDGCYPYYDRFGYSYCYCNASSTTSATIGPLECPYGCYIGQDSYGYPICHCEGTTMSTPCPFGCYNVTYYFGSSYCECSSPQPTTPPTAICPTGCSPDRDFWGTPYCRCNSSYSATTPYPPYPTTPPPCYSPCYYQYDFYGYPYCVCTTNNMTDSNTTDIPCNYPCYYTYDNYDRLVCSCGLSTTTAPCYLPCRYQYDYYGRQYCSCNSSNTNSVAVTTGAPCNYPCYYNYDFYGRPYCDCAMTTTVQPCYSPCRYEYDYYGRQYCSCNSTTTSCNYPCYYGYDYDWHYVCLCNASTTTVLPTTSQPGCNVTQNSPMGTLTSPNYPNTYPVNVNCAQSITVPMANSIQLMFVDINMYYSSAESCLYDWVEITGCDGSVRQHCAYNSVNIPLDFICTDSYTVTVLFHSSFYNYYSYRGFKLNYRSAFGSSCNSTGGLVSLGSRGNIVSPNYPASYPLSNDCYYLLQAEERHTIRIRVAFELLMMQDSTGCSQEFIRLNCLDGSGSPWFVCGTRIPSPVTFNCSSVEIQFHSEKPPSAGRSPRLFRIVYYGVEGPAFAPSTPVSSAVSFRSKLGSSGTGMARGVLLLLLVTLARKTFG